jgi:hypothetical protein
MTKLVNEQLYQEINRQENIIKIFKEAFKNMMTKKLFKNQENDEC